MPAIGTFTSAKQFIGIAPEATPGTPVAMVATIACDKFDGADKPTWLDDNAWTGSMVETRGTQPGVIKTDFTMSGSCYGDTLGWLLRNILGDVSYSGGTIAGASTTTTGALTAGVTSVVPVTSATGIVPGTVLSIDTAGLLELVTVLSVASLNVTLTAPVQRSHLTAATVQPVTAPFNGKFSVLNSGNGQPVTHTLTHFQGTPTGSGARQYSSACLSDLTLKWNAETALFTYEAKGMAWASNIAAAPPTAAPSTVPPIASWRALLGVAGPASSTTLVATATDGEIVIKRTLDAVYTAQNSQNPYIIQRGAVGVTGKLNFVAVTNAFGGASPAEQPYLYMLNNTQPQLQLVLDNGAAGAAKITHTINTQQAAVTAAAYDGSKSAVMYKADFKAIPTVTDAGNSGGISPMAYTLANAVPPYTY
jgi:hypothetical protein